MPHTVDATKHIVTSELSYRNAQVVDPHSHRRGQLIYATAGVMEVVVGNKLWLVPPQRGVWMPSGVVHQMRARGSVELKTVYVSPDVIPRTFPSSPILVSVSSLLRELILRSVDSPNNHDTYDLKNRILLLILDEIKALLRESEGTIPLELALPQLVWSDRP